MWEPRSGNKIGDPAGTRAEVWPKEGQHSGCPGLATLGPLPRPLVCVLCRRETTENNGPSVVIIREKRERTARGIWGSLLWLSQGMGNGAERNSMEREDWQWLGRGRRTAKVVAESCQF